MRHIRRARSLLLVLDAMLLFNEILPYIKIIYFRYFANNINISNIFCCKVADGDGLAVMFAISHGSYV